MAIEIEHKFLLATNEWRKLVDYKIDYRQGYFSSNPSTSIRIRTSNNRAWLNIKSATIGNQRHEYEYEIPIVDGNEMIDTLCRSPIIEKTRHFIKADSHTWEIDEFNGLNQGLIVAEIELSNQDEVFELPTWLGIEVTHDMRYYNNNLVKHPFSEWGK